jgi:RHS repeat-associated protein
MMYDGAGRRVSKTSMRKVAGEWDTLKVTHYTGIGTEIREEIADSAAGTKVVVPMPQGLGRYGIESASDPGTGARTFEWYLKNHLSSTMLVYGTGGGTSGGLKAAYDYRSFGEQIDLTKRNDKVTENFTGKEKDDETELNYFGARYLDPMLGMWISVDPKRQFASPYLYAGNGYNPVNGVDADGNIVIAATKQDQKIYAQFTKNLNAEQAQRLSAVERDKNFVLKFHAVDGLIPIPSEYDPNKVVAVSKGYVDATTYADQNFAAAIVCYTCEDAQGTFAHELAGHGKQILDFLNGGGITGARTLKEAAPWIEKKIKWI